VEPGLRTGWINLENAVETTDCPMSLRSETRMKTDYQSNTIFRAITPQTSGFDPDFFPELFMVPRSFQWVDRQTESKTQKFCPLRGFING
jgi:hypothetical protein